MNVFGNKLRISVFGESHGAAIGVVLDGVAAGIPLCEEDFEEALRRRKYGDIQTLSGSTTPRKEDDKPLILSGVANGFTTGAPLTIIFENKDQHSSDYSQFKATPRPGHADFVASRKFEGFNDIRGGGHFSGRVTLTLVAAGVVARKIINAKGNVNTNTDTNITFHAEITEIGGCADPEKWPELLEKAKAAGDSAGGIVECRVNNVPVGIGEPFFDSLEAVIAHLAFSIPGVKGVEFGDLPKFGAARALGSEFNDRIVSTEGKTASNHSGGINGGITNGNPVIFRVCIRPTASIAKPQKTLNFQTGSVEELKITGRHDACIALRCPVIVESVAALAFANLMP